MTRRPDRERAFLAAYRPEAFARPSVAVDVAIFTVSGGELAVLLVRRGEPPFEGRLALPGGFVRVGDARRDQGEDLVDAARRELEEETGLAPRDVWLEQLGAFGRPYRDPRMRVVSIVYFALVRPDLAPRVRAGGDADAARWVPIRRRAPRALAFDHGEILDATLARLRGAADTTDITRHLVGATFTIPELRAVRALLTGEPQDPGNFRRRFQRLLDDRVVLPVPDKRRTLTKPATLYRFAPRARARRA